MSDETFYAVGAGLAMAGVTVVVGVAWWHFLGWLVRRK